MRQSKPSFFLMKNTGAPIGDLDGWMWPFTRFSQRKSSSSFCSAGDRGNVQEQGSSVPGVRSMAWSHAFCGGSSSKASLEKTSLKSWYGAGTMFSRGWLSSAFCTSWASCCDGVSIALMWCSAHSGLSSKVGNCKAHFLHVLAILEYDLNFLCDGSILIWSSINIVNWYWVWQGASLQLVLLGKGSVDKHPCHT